MNSREKIHELVNMARHPEAKDLAEALDKESKITGCLIEDIESPLAPQYRKIVRATILWNELDWVGNERYYCYKNNHTYTVVKKQVKILGRPITAFDVCCALNKKQSKYHYFATDNGIWAGYGLKDKCEGIIALIVEFKTKESDGTDIFLRMWGDEESGDYNWSDDTSDEIVKLINL